MVDKDKLELRKKCPFLGETCTGEACPIYIQVAQVQTGPLGTSKAVMSGTCSFPAFTMIMTTVVQLLQQQLAMQQAQARPKPIPGLRFHQG